MKEALFYEKEKDSIKCTLCPHFCIIKEGNVGNCGVRKNIKQILYSLVYGKSVSTAIDPIEKKPLYNFLPNTKTFSIATVGCNFHCRFCQNFEISQSKKIMGDELMPEEIVKLALKNNCPSISYTYTEPTIFYEYALDTAKLAKKAGLKNVFVTNGYINPEPLKSIAPYLDAANIDLKAFSERFYNELVGAKMQPVLDSIKLYHELGIHIELTTLIIPNYNDSSEELTKLTSFIAGIDKDMPWHISRYFPRYKMNENVTSIESMKKAEDIGKKAGLRRIYLGNV